MTYCIVTFIFNGYEFVREPLEVDHNADYFLFTDNRNLISEKWNVIYLEKFDTNELTGVQKTFYFKHQLYKYIPNLDDYDYIVRMDGSLRLEKSLAPIIDYLRVNKYDISVDTHHMRNNLLDEYDAWINGRSLNPVYKQIFIDFAKDTYNFDWIGLLETTIMIYRNCKECWNFLDDVHNVLTYLTDNKDANDQCYFTYFLCKHMNNLRINYFPTTFHRCSKYMKVYFHNTNTRVDNYIPYQKYVNYFNNIIQISDFFEK